MTNNILVEPWYAGGPNGDYSVETDNDTSLQYRGRLLTDECGKFTFISTFPKIYPSRPIRHIHFKFSTWISTSSTEESISTTTNDDIDSDTVIVVGNSTEDTIVTNSTNTSSANGTNSTSNNETTTATADATIEPTSGPMDDGTATVPATSTVASDSEVGIIESSGFIDKELLVTQMYFNKYIPKGFNPNSIQVVDIVTDDSDDGDGGKIVYFNVHLKDVPGAASPAESNCTKFVYTGPRKQSSGGSAAKSSILSYFAMWTALSAIYWR